MKRRAAPGALSAVTVEKTEAIRANGEAKLPAKQGEK